MPVAPSLEKQNRIGDRGVATRHLDALLAEATEVCAFIVDGEELVVFTRRPGGLAAAVQAAADGLAELIGRQRE